MSKVSSIERHAHAALEVLRKFGTRGPDASPVLSRSYHPLLVPHLTGLLAGILQGDSGLDLAERASFDQLVSACGWDLSAYRLLRVPGVVWPPPANVPPELAYEAARFERLEVALKTLAAEPDVPPPAASIADKPDSKTDTKKKCGAIVPDNPDVAKLAKKIRQELPKGGTKKDIALDFTEGDRKRAANLLRQLQPSRYGHLLD